MIVTLDGPSGSGKTTQREIFKNRYGFAAEWQSSGTHFDSSTLLQCLDRWSYSSTNIMTDHFWDVIVRLTKSECFNRSLIQMLETIEYYGIPHVSVILHSPLSVCGPRVIERDVAEMPERAAKYRNMLKNQPLDDCLLSRWTTISHVFCNAYMLDASLPVESVTQSILELIEKHS